MFQHKSTSLGSVLYAKKPLRITVTLSFLLDRHWHPVLWSISKRLLIICVCLHSFIGCPLLLDSFSFFGGRFDLIKCISTFFRFTQSYSVSSFIIKILGLVYLTVKDRPFWSSNTSQLWVVSNKTLFADLILEIWEKS